MIWKVSDIKAAGEVECGMTEDGYGPRVPLKTQVAVREACKQALEGIDYKQTTWVLYNWTER